MSTIANPKILAVDDAPDNLFLLELLLGEEKDYQLSCFSRGKSAIKAVESAPPDLILLDIGMPDLDGFEVTRRIRNNDALPYIPIVIMTAHDASVTQRALAAGADKIIHKPYEIQNLLETVETFLLHQCECGCGCE
ncbi:MAG: response regulator [Cyanobacteria bacterium J06598_3]